MFSISLTSCVYKISYEINLCRLINKATRLRNNLEKTEIQILTQMKKQIVP
jgi:hypothetical protein